MATNQISAVGSTDASGSNKALSQINAATNSASANNSFADSISKSLTSGGKVTFETPGAQKDFESGMRSAISNMIEGGKSGNNEQMMKGITELLSLIGGLASSQGKKGGEEDGTPKKGDDAQGAQGSSPASGASGASGAESDDKKKKLMELIQMLMAMGVSPEMISQLLQSMGIPAAEAQQMMSQAQQQQGEKSTAGGGAGTEQANVLNRGAIPA